MENKKEEEKVIKAEGKKKEAKKERGKDSVKGKK